MNENLIKTQCQGNNMGKVDPRKKSSVDPFGESSIQDYENLFKEFGIKSIEPLLKKIKNPHMFMRRGIDFGHRDLDKFLASKNRAVMSGIKPTGEFHLGSKMIAEKMIYFQQEFKTKVFYSVADIEAYEDNGTPLEQSAKIAIDNVADTLALGLDPKNAYIYKQSTELRVQKMAFLFAPKITTNTFKAVYGERKIGLYMAALLQSGDILMPEMEVGYTSTLVPIGVDQDPHMRLTRDIAAKFNLPLPCSIYNKFFRALDGSAKMSKRNPMGYLTLNDSPEIVKKKVMSTLTGGRDTLVEQKRLGGRPDKCMIYELMYFHFEQDDKKLKEFYNKCKSGELTCGECKKMNLDKIISFYNKHQLKKKKMIPKAKKILE
ncbi:MAG: tryptophan--tRNA ligase [Candidatus Thorarchaeota archaeon]|nr:MAG: tryptophan--tRNA ligase [Candidatus Thorarchaeota archaeon]